MVAFPQAALLISNFPLPQWEICLKLCNIHLFIDQSQYAREAGSELLILTINPCPHEK